MESFSFFWRSNGFVAHEQLCNLKGQPGSSATPVSWSWVLKSCCFGEFLCWFFLPFLLRLFFLCAMKRSSSWKVRGEQSPLAFLQFLEVKARQAALFHKTDKLSLPDFSQLGPINLYNETLYSPQTKSNYTSLGKGGASASTGRMWARVRWKGFGFNCLNFLHSAVVLQWW